MKRLNDATPQEWTAAFNQMLEKRATAASRPIGLTVPPGYENAKMALTTDNRLVLAHPLHPPVVYDEAGQRWVPVTAST